MSDFHSDWIERNVYLRPKPGSKPEDHHYEQFERPVIVCLCGSTRFGDAYREAMRAETLNGRIVLSVGLLGHTEGIDMDGPVKAMLDELHMRKIDLADEVLILNRKSTFCHACETWHHSLDCLCKNCGRKIVWLPYIGESTRRELEHARRSGKTVRFLEPETTAL